MSIILVPREIQTYSRGEKSVIFCIRDLLTRNITDFSPRLYMTLAMSLTKLFVDVSSDLDIDGRDKRKLLIKFLLRSTPAMEAEG